MPHIAKAAGAVPGQPAFTVTAPDRLWTADITEPLIGPPTNKMFRPESGGLMSSAL
jgi:hypothetical protein